MKNKSKSISYRTPAEWEARTGTLLAWPPENSCLCFVEDIWSTYYELISLLRAHEEIRLLVPHEIAKTLEKKIGGTDYSLILEPFPVNDIWMRDAGPIPAIQSENGNQTPVFLDGGFNGWGGKHPYELDSLITTILARRWKQKKVDLNITVEGGAIEVNGAGDLLTTRSVLLNPNRDNPPIERIEWVLRNYFGAERIHWLDRGLTNDDTDGHIDNLARFVSTNTIVYCGSAGSDKHPDYDLLNNIKKTLEGIHTNNGPAELVELPLPEIFDRRGRRRLCASYTNFYIARDIVLMPTFDKPTDERARGILQELFPKHKVHTLDSRSLVSHGGAIHCIAQPLTLSK